MTERSSGTPRLLRSALVTSTLSMVVLGSAALAAPAAADAPRQALSPRSATPANIQTAQSRPSSATLASGIPAALTASVASAPGATSSGTYTVKAGDTLSGIAARHGIGLSQLLRANGLSMSSQIQPGQKIKLSASATSSASSTAETYTVKAGDTLSGIAARHGIGLSVLRTANGMTTSSVIHPGQQLKLSGSASSQDDLVPDTFLHYTYPDHVVRSANVNKRALLDSGVPSRSQMQAIIADTARSMGVDPSLALAHAYVESAFDHTSVSPANAIGAMQVIPDSGRWASGMVGRRLNLLDPYDNATAGVAIIRQLQSTAQSKDAGIGAYYQGLRGVEDNGMYPDTEQYVTKVKEYQKRF